MVRNMCQSTNLACLILQTNFNTILTLFEKTTFQVLLDSISDYVYIC